ncbi:MAG: exodeoxyribonuclease III [Deltaproteobacteria bacterium]|nr:exodeoxyribonuclease III [Deltaproteobacteria bacterium]
MKLISWNVNGIRACAKKGFLQWLEKESPEILALQETKAHPDQLEKELLAPLGYQTFWASAKKKGYSGVALFIKTKFIDVKVGLDIEEFDSEGRTLIAEFPDFFFLNGYFPNGQPDLGRVPYKLRYSDAMMEKALDLRNKFKKPVIICGDYNTAHQEVDLARPKENKENTGFLPIERAWVDKHIQQGFIDIFRQFQQGNGHYSWWSYRANARENNVGWRIDYFFITEELKSRVKSSYYQPEVMGSDHCPVVLELN